MPLPISFKFALLLFEKFTLVSSSTLEKLSLLNTEKFAISEEISFLAKLSSKLRLLRLLKLISSFKDFTLPTGSSILVEKIVRVTAL